VAPLTRRIAPAVSRHPGIWDLTGRVLPGATADTLVERSVRPFATIDLTADGLGPAHAFRSCAEFEFVESLHRSRHPSVLLSSGGWATTGGIALEEHGVIDYAHYRDRRPGFRRTVVVNALRAARAPRVETALSFRTFGEANYFHLLNDLIGGRLRMFDEAGAPADTPIVVARRLAEFPPFRDLQSRPGLQDRRWIVQEPGTMLRCRRLFVARTGPFSRAGIEYTQRALGVPASDAHDAERIFVDRGSRGTRDIVNRSDVESVCRRFGFSIVDPGGMTLTEQMERFSRAEFVIGVHGAGLTNIIFRRDAPLHLLEIFPGPPARNAAHYFFICRTHGHGYTALLGESTEAYPWPGRFTLDPHKLETAIDAMLSGTSERGMTPGPSDTPST